MINILIVEDSPLVSKVLTKLFDSDRELKVVGVAATGREGIRLASSLKPDIITMDIMMPDMNGVEATKQIMAYQPTPILLLTSSYPRKMDEVFKAISFGALDVVEKINFENDFIEEKVKDSLIDKIKLLSKVKVIKHPLAKLEKSAMPAASLKIGQAPPKETLLRKIVAIAASTGGPQALSSVLTGIPKNFPWGIVIVQHIAKGFDRGLVEWLANSCAVKIKLAENNESIEAGTAYVAPNDFQMKVVKSGAVELSDEPPYGNFKPSADVLFKSVADVYKHESVGVILTGMGRDGAGGIKAIKEAGGKTIAQDEKTCIVFGMPKEAIDLGAVDKVLPIDKIAGEIINNS